MPTAIKAEERPEFMMRAYKTLAERVPKDPEKENGFVVLPLRKSPVKQVARSLGVTDNQSSALLRGLSEVGIYRHEYMGDGKWAWLLTPGVVSIKETPKGQLVAVTRQRPVRRATKPPAAEAPATPKADPAATIGAHQAVLLKLEEKVGALMKLNADLQIDKEKQAAQITQLESELASAKATIQAYQDAMSSLELPTGLKQFLKS